MIPFITQSTSASQEFGVLAVRETFGERLFQMLVIGSVLLEIVVFHEPAPVDAVIIFALGLGLFLGNLDFSTVTKWSVVCLAIFALGNLASMYDPFDLTRAVWYVFVTMYLIGSWFFFVGVIGRYGTGFMSVLIDTYCFAGLVSALLGIGGYFHLLPHENLLLLQGRARGLFKDCNVFGPFLVPVALFALTKLMNPKSTGAAKASALISFLAGVVAMLVCFSRACWLNLGVAIVVFFGLHAMLAYSGKRVLPRIRTGVLVVVAGGVASVVLMNTAAVKDMMAVRVTQNGLQKYDRIRFATQLLSLDVAEERPLGIGPGQAELVFGYATHSMYLRILSENGVIALLALLGFIGATIGRSWTVMQHTRNPWVRELNVVILACIAGHLVNSVVIDTVHWRHIWFIYALPWANVRLPSSVLRRRVMQPAPILATQPLETA